MSRVTILTCLLAPVLLSACVSRERPPEVPATTAPYPAESYLQLGRYLEAREAAQHEFAAAKDRGDSEAALDAQLNLGEALVELKEHSLARGYLVDVLRNGDPSRREDARALLALSHDKEGNHELARSYYEEVRRDRVDPQIWSRVTRRLSRQVLAAGSEAVPRRPRTPYLPPTAILPRSRWRAAPLRAYEADPMERITKITVHHTGMLAHPMSEAEVAEREVGLGLVDDEGVREHRDRRRERGQASIDHHRAGGAEDRSLDVEVQIVDGDAPETPAVGGRYR